MTVAPATSPFCSGTAQADRSRDLQRFERVRRDGSEGSRLPLLFQSAAEEGAQRDLTGRGDPQLVRCEIGFDRGIR